MANAAEIYGKGLILSGYLYEGVFTRRDVYRDDGTLLKGGTFSSVIVKGDPVQVYTDSFSGSDPIFAADRTDTTFETNSGFSGALGFVITTPEGKVPDVSADGGTFTASSQKDLRFADILLPGYSSVLNFKVGDASKAGAFVGWDTSEAQMTTNSASVSFRPFVLLQSSSAASTRSVLL